jgi:iron complex transport system ATP-binding protein
MSEIIEHTVLKTTNLSVGYASKTDHRIIADKINVNLKKGKLTCLLGKNGVGKSTLLRTLSKMQPRLGGSVELENRNLDDYARNDLAKKISLVLTERIPTSNLTVFELIALGRQPYTNWIGKLNQEDRQQINLAIEQSHLKDLVDQRCDELSDGQLQRAMICRALAQNTDIIILDEPTAHLDIQHKIETFKLLSNIARKLNRSILISTHEIQLATQMADELWLMTNNKIITGEPKILIDSDKINLLFDSKSIIFDKESNQFIIK